MDWRRVKFCVGLTAVILTMMFFLKESAEGGQYGLKKYLPLSEGITWNYLQQYQDGSKNYEVYCVGGTEEVEGQVTKKYWGFDSGSLEDFEIVYGCKAWTRDGLISYKTVYSDGSYVICDPPMSIPLHMGLGDTLENESVCREYDSNGNVVNTWNYIEELTLEAEEDITVMAGTFVGCLRFSGSEHEDGNLYEFTIWLAPGIGEVKRVFPDSEERELISFTKGGTTYYPGY